MAPVVGFVGGMFGIGGGLAAGGALWGGWVAGAGFATTVLGSITVKMLTSVAFSALQSALAPKPKQGGGITISSTVAGEDNPETIILGRYATGGQAICPPYSHGPSNRWLTHVIELCSAPGASLERLMIGDKWVTLKPYGKPGYEDYGLTVEGDLDGYVFVKFHDGSQTEADPLLRAKYGTHPERPWTADMVGHGICYVILHFYYDQKKQPSVPRYRFELGGIPLYDIRKDTLAGGDGPQRLADPSTWTRTDNPIVIAWNIMRGILLPGGDIWGGRIDHLRRLPQAVWVAAMNRCDVPVETDDGTEPMYRAGIEALLTQPPASTLEELFKVAAATIADLGYGWGISVGAPPLPVYSFTDDDVIVSRPQELDPFPGFTDTYNAVTAKFPDPEHFWETKEAPQRTNAAWEAADGFGREAADLALPAAPYKFQVQRLMQAWIEDERRFLRHSHCLPIDAAHVELTDTVSWTSARNSYVDREFKVCETLEDPRTGIRQVSLKEVDAADWIPPPSYVLPTPPAAPPSIVAATVDGFDVAQAVMFDAQDVPRRGGIRLLWSPDITGDGLKWWARRSGETEIVLQGATQALADGYLDVFEGVLPDTAYEVQAELIAPRATVPTAWLPVTTPDIRLTLPDLATEVAGWLTRLQEWIAGGVTNLPGDLSALTAAISAEVADRAAAVAALAAQLSAETAERVEEAHAAAQRWRDYGDRIRALAAEVLELGTAGWAAREELRRRISVEIEGSRAEYRELITVLADAGAAVAQRVTTLEAETGGLSAAITTADQARVAGDEALALMIATLSVGSAVMFDHAAIWYFDASVEGWTGSPAEPTVTGGWLRPGAASHIVSPAGLAVDGAAYGQVRARVRITGTPTWLGQLWWAAEGEGWDAGRSVTIAEPAWDGDEAVVTFNAPWTGPIDRIRLDLTASGDDAELDWIAIGRPAPGASSADLAAERQARIGALAALAEDVLVLDARLTDAEGAQEATAGAVAALTTRVEDTEDGLAAEAERIDGIEAQIEDPASGLAALASAIDQLETGVEAGEDATSIVAQATRTLRSAQRAITAEALEATAGRVLDDWRNRDLIAQATQALGTRIDLTDDQVRIVADAVTALQAALPGLAAADALSALQAVVAEQADSISAAASALVDLSAELDGLGDEMDTKAAADVVSALSATVEEQGDTIAAQAASLTSLSSSLGDLGDVVGGKLDAGVIMDYYTKTQTDAVATSAAAAATTTLKSQLEGPGGSINEAQAAADDAAALAGTKADASALTALATRVTEAEGDIQSTATSLANLGATVGGISATVTTQGTAIATLNDRAAATYTIRVVGGDAEAGFELVAADDPIDGPASAIRFRADYLLFEGTITAEYLNVDFLRGGRILAEYLDIETRLTIMTGGALSYGKTSVASESDGIYFGHDGGRFGLSASRTTPEGLNQSLRLSEASGLHLRNARHTVTGLSAPVTVETGVSVAKTNLPPGIKTITIEGVGGGAAGRTIRATSKTAYTTWDGGAGGITTIKLYDGATLKQTVTCAGAAATYTAGAGGKPSAYAAGGAPAEGMVTENGNPGLKGSGGSGGSSVFGNTKWSGWGGNAAAQVSLETIDLSGYADPEIEIVIGAGGVPHNPGALSNLALGGAGGDGFVRYSYSTVADQPADVVPLVPTAVGSFTTPASGGAGSFPDLGPGLWVLHRNTTGSGVGLGYVTTSPGSVVRAHEPTCVTLIASQTPTFANANNSWTVWYSFYSMSKWGG